MVTLGNTEHDNYLLHTTSKWLAGLVVCMWGLVLFPQEAKAKPKVTVNRLKINVLPLQVFRLPKDDMACFRYVKQHVKRKPLWSKTYPTTVKQAIKWIVNARKSGAFDTERGMILGRLQNVIDRPRISRLHMLFGNNHNVISHYRFFNELLFPGKDGVRLSGITHLALEAFVSEPNVKPLSRRMRRLLKRFWTGKGNRRVMLGHVALRRQLANLVSEDQQRFIELYMRRGARWSFHILEVLSHFLLGSAYSSDLLQEMLATLRHARTYPKRKLRVLATDMSLRMHKRARHLACWLYSLREVFGLYAVNRQAVRRQNVILYMWGAHHIRKDHFPRFIPPSETVYAVRMQGGGKPDVWDRALSSLHLPMKMFAIPTPGAREGDLLIHFPPKGRVMLAFGQKARLATSKLARQPNARKHRGIRRKRLFPSYQNTVRLVLKQLHGSLRFCYRGGPKQALVKMTINGSGRVSRVRFASSVRRTGWSLACLQRRLWRMPMPRPPRRRTTTIAFRLRYARQ